MMLWALKPGTVFDLNHVWRLPRFHHHVHPGHALQMQDAVHFLGGALHGLDGGIVDVRWGDFVALAVVLRRVVEEVVVRTISVMGSA